MSTVSRREVTTVRTEFVVPASYPYGADWNQVQQAINAASRELIEQGRVDEGLEPADDLIRILPTGDTVIVYYETETLVGRRDV